MQLVSVLCLPVSSIPTSLSFFKSFCPCKLLVNVQLLVTPYLTISSAMNTIALANITNNPIPICLSIEGIYFRILQTRMHVCIIALHIGNAMAPAQYIIPLFSIMHRLNVCLA